MKKIQLLLIHLIFFGSILEAQIFVDQSATGANDGSSWSNAFANLQDAIDSAASGDELWLKYGTYVPDRDTSGNIAPGDPKEKAFVVAGKSIALYGGFAGFETTLSQRDLENLSTGLSGDQGVAFDSSDNSYVILYSVGSGTVTLDGLEFYRANSMQAPGYYKAALTCIGRTDVRNCKFFNNYSNRGGAITNLGAQLIVEKSEFAGNFAIAQGGAVYSEYASTFRSSRFYNNYSQYGGALKFTFASGGVNTVENCVFYNNVAALGGGAIQVYAAEVEVFSSTFFNNASLINQGHAFSIYDAIMFNVYNSIVWNSNLTSTLAYTQNGNNVYQFDNCLVSFGGVSGANIIVDVDPQFSDTTFVFKLTSCSPALNSGDTQFKPASMNTDLIGNPRVNGPNIDMGAIEHKDFEIAFSGSQLYYNDEVYPDSYQWIDCSTGMPIPGETSDGFSPTISGDYALIYAFGTCIDTTACISVTFAGIEHEEVNTISVYPNPSKGFINIANPNSSDLRVSLNNTNGQTLKSWELKNGTATLDMNVQPGLYILNIMDENGRLSHEKIVVE